MDAETPVIDPKDKLPILHAEEITLEDGRSLVYYTFEFEEGEGE
jgi:hypothetical protein